MAAVAASFYGIARAAGFADLGRPVELVEEPHRVSDRPVTSSHTANHPGTPEPAAKRRATRLGEIAKAAPELSPVTAGSISEAARRPDWRAPYIHPRFPEACSPAK